MEYYLGVDMGTTAVKAVAFSEVGKILALETGGYEMLHPLPDQSELIPDEILDVVTSTINAVYTQLFPAKPVFVSFSAAMHSLIAVDENGIPMTNCLIWADNRAIDIADQLRRSENGPRFYQASGVPVHAMSPMCKLLWLKKNNAAVFQKAHRFIGIKEYIFFKYFGKYVVDTSVASATGLLNMRSLQWDEDILAYVGLTSDRLSEIVSVKKRFILKSPPDAKDLQLPDGITMVIGASDGASANLGIETTDESPLVITIGTSSAVRMLFDNPATDAQMRTFCYHAMDRQYIIGGAGNNGAVVLDWLKETLLEAKEESMQEFLDLANAVPPASDGLLFLPYILGERAPTWNALAKGVFFGLTITHTRAHMVRAAIEAVVYSIYSMSKAIVENRSGLTIYATGGFARNPLWVQILADVFNRRVVLSGSSESSAWGAVVIGMNELGIIAPKQHKEITIVDPVASAHKIYANQLLKFERLYATLEPEFFNAAGNAE